MSTVLRQGKICFQTDSNQHDLGKTIWKNKLCFVIPFLNTMKNANIVYLPEIRLFFFTTAAFTVTAENYFNKGKD